MANELLITKQIKIMEKTITTNTDLRNDLLDVYAQLRNGEIGQSKAKELANVAGKIIGSAKSQLEYNKWAKCDSKIDFFEG